MKKLVLLGLSTVTTVAVLGVATPAQAAGYCNGQIDYACTDRSDGNTFCTLWINGCYIGI